MIVLIMKLVPSSIFLSTFISCIKADCANPKVDTVNVKTVLWRCGDTSKICWSKSEELLLYTRRVAQDLLPKKIPKDMSRTVHYLEIIWEAVEKFSPRISVSKEILRPAIADVLGGYLQSVALPMVNEKYYAGVVDYAVIKSFYDLFHRVKAYLDTDGRGWHRPCDMKQIPTRVTSFDYHQIPSEVDRYACDELILPKPTEPVEITKNCEIPIASREHELPTKVSVPFLDDETRPTSVMIPLRGQYVYSLTSPASAHILARYYNLALRCIGKSDRETMLNFNHAFFNWIITHVSPHLHTTTNCNMETEWYSAFGSVMRILETMHQNGLTPGESRGHYYGVYEKQRHGGSPNFNVFGKAILDIATGEGSGKHMGGSSFSISYYLQRLREIIVDNSYWIAIGLVILLAILLCCLFICSGERQNFARKTDAQPFISLYYQCLRTIGIKTESDTNSKISNSSSQGPSQDFHSRKPSANIHSERRMTSHVSDESTASSSSTIQLNRKSPGQIRKPPRKEKKTKAEKRTRNSEMYYSKPSIRKKMATS